MATVSFKYNYRFGTGYRYYKGGTPHSPYDTGLDDFVIDHLNRTRRDLILQLSNMRRRGEGVVRKRSRVRTGLMKRSVTGTGDFGTDILKISFGWESAYPPYSPFQEFGTRTGIEPMMAVYTAYHQVLAELRGALGGR